MSGSIDLKSKMKETNKEVAHKLAAMASTMVASEFELAIAEVLDAKDDAYLEQTIEERGFGACTSMAEVFTGMLGYICDLKDARNYMEFQMHTGEGTPFIFTVRRHDGETPGQRASRLEKECERMRTHIRAAHGSTCHCVDCAPGGS